MSIVFGVYNFCEESENGHTTKTFKTTTAKSPTRPYTTTNKNRSSYLKEKSFSEAKVYHKRTPKSDRKANSVMKMKKKSNMREEVDISDLPVYEPESSQAPVNLTTYERIDSIVPINVNTELNKSMSVSSTSPGKKPRANRRMRETRAKSRNYSRYSGDDKEEKGEVGYEVDMEEMNESKVVYEVNANGNDDDEVLQRLNDGVK